MIGELYCTYTFPAPRAKLAWERVANRTRNCSVNRWAIDPMDLTGEHAITVMTEREDRGHLDLAARLLAAMGGREIDTPELVIDALRAKRVRKGDGARHIVRNPSGTVVLRNGEEMQRPQG